MSGWTRVTEGEMLVLAVDFDGTGRPEATFRDLARRLPEPLELWHAVPPPRGGVSPDLYLDWWRPDQGRPIHAVLGYCAGSAFACALADELEHHQADRPTVVLFNPGLPTVETLDRDVSGIIDSMPGLTDAERRALHRRRSAIRGDFDAAGGEFTAMYREACDVLFARLDIDPEVGDQLTSLFGSYVAYLTAARRIERRPGWASAVSLTSREQWGTGRTGRELRFDVPRRDLLRAEDVARAAFGLLTSVSQR